MQFYLQWKHTQQHVINYLCSLGRPHLQVRCAQAAVWREAPVEAQQKAVYIYSYDLYCMLAVRAPRFSRAVPAVSVKTDLIVRLAVLF